MIIGIDIGGTHTDGVLIKNQQIHQTSKVITDQNNLTTSILKVLDNLLLNQDKDQVTRIVFSTTLTTNLIAQKNYPPTGLIMIPGPGLNPDWLKIAAHNWVISGSIDHRGRQVTAFNQEELNQLQAEIQCTGITDLAIVGKFSTRNPVQEKQLTAFLQSSLPDRLRNIQLGHQIAPVLNFPRRVQTTWLNTAVYQEYSKFAASVQRSVLERGITAELFLLKADGGTMPLENGLSAGVETIKSGPAASIMGFLALTGTDNRTSLLLDIGGTTTDIALLIGGIPLFEPEGVQIGNYNTSVRGLLNRSISFGGDSYVYKDQTGNIRLQSKRIGPAAAFGGNTPTLTDALVITKLMSEGDREHAFSAFEQLTENNDPNQIITTARAIIQQFYQIIASEVEKLLNELKQRPVYTIHELLTDSELKPEVVMMIGGPASALLPGIAEFLDLEPVLPRYHHVANALGAALARPTLRETLYADTEQRFYILSGKDEASGKQSINHTQKNNFTLDKAKKILLDYTTSLAVQKQNPVCSDDFVEITFEESFNIVRDYQTRGQIFRLEAQIKPGIISDFTDTFITKTNSTSPLSPERRVKP